MFDAAKVAVALEALRRAFPDRPFPQGKAVVRGGQSHDPTGQSHRHEDPEAVGVARFFAGAPWKSVSGPALLAWGMAGVALRHLTPEALAYYLPAYLTAFLTEPLEPVSFAVLESAVSVLTAPEKVSGPPPGGRSDAQWQAMARERAEKFHAFAGALTDAQRAAVRAFLEAVESVFEEPGMENPVRTALERYWES
ncbi:hypothetical protein JY651_26680 [Pyxidicoccus parkwayensis]|uniref:Uncharacterized protein n=1 Tax=Pyxidicoccus parkwayensis TaxID=2813578 RepID=A0ABX7NMX5_9BACT|nr:hypothetical protein [Pyxidicoccus parkwaysis]QSQ18940.1 hypothetical protein JY651_26680 [Pyxidicoccus parkwaysis]